MSYFKIKKIFFSNKIFVDVINLKFHQSSFPFIHKNNNNNNKAES